MKTSALIGIGVAVSLASGIFIGEALAAQPHMQAALDALRTAKAELIASTPNKAGHRATALRLVNEAITETEAGMEAAPGGY